MTCVGTSRISFTLLGLTTIPYLLIVCWSVNWLDTMDAHFVGYKFTLLPLGLSMQKYIGSSYLEIHRAKLLFFSRNYYVGWLSMYMNYLLAAWI